MKYRTKIFTLFLVFCMVLQFLPTIPSHAAPTGDPKLITTAEQLNDIRNNLSSHFILMNDITVTSWIPIGSKATGAQFTGIFDGNGYTITISSGSVSSPSYAGFFGYTNGATIQNLTLKAESSDIIVQGTTTNAYTGSFVGYAQGTLILTNCHSSLNVTGTTYTGGLVGYGFDVRITGCSYTGKVKGTSYVGGIIGKAVRETVSTNAPIITKSFVTGKVNGSGSYIGGIVGQLTGNVSDCYTTGSVTGSTHVGGIAGKLLVAASTGSNIENCYSNGDITSTNGSTGYTGGIVGDVTSTSKATHRIQNCYSTGKLYNSGGNSTGGIAGYNYSTTCYSKITGCVAINLEIRQKNNSKNGIARVIGNTYFLGTNYAWSDMPVYYANGTALTSFSEPKHGTGITIETLKTKAFYEEIGWNFDTIWTIRQFVSPYPILAWSDPKPVEEDSDEDDSFLLGHVGITLNIGESYQLVGLLNDLSEVDASDLIWDSDDETVAAVDSAGKVTAVNTGLAMITALDEAGTIRFIYVLVEKAAPIGSGYIGITLKEGETCNLIGLLTNLKKANPATLTWESSDSDIATVDDFGKVTAVSVGLVLITVKDIKGTAGTVYILVKEMMDEETVNGDGIRQVSAGYYHMLAIAENGDLYAWGRNNHGKLGDGTMTNRSTPIKVLENVKTVSATFFDNTFAITENGDLYAWGRNYYGVLGEGTTTDRSTPVKVLENVKTVSSAWGYTLAITENGDLYTWGNNIYGQLGDGTTTDRSTPVKVLENVKTVSASNHTLAITENGDLYTWGHNNYGQLGDGTTIDRSTPIKILENVKTISAGERHTLAITESGDLFTCGNNYYGQLGDGTTTDRSILVKVLQNVKIVSTNAEASYTLAITENGDLYAWGDNNLGQLGDATTINRSTPIKVIENVKIAGINYNGGSFALIDNGDLYAWGFNKYGQLGDGTTTNRSTPVKVIENVKIVSGGGNYTLVITENGDLYTWGHNNYGQLGDGTTTDRYSPVKIELFNQ